MEQVVQPQGAAAIRKPDYREAWEMVSGQLRSEMSRAEFETWVRPLKPLGYAEHVFRLGALNTFTQEWVESRLKNRITSILNGMLNEPVTLRVVVSNSYNSKSAVVSPDSKIPPAAAIDPPEEDEPMPESGDDAPVELPDEELADAIDDKSSPRKMMLRRAYGSQRARVIQPERGMFVTLYFFQQWLPLIGHSAFTVILAARSMCYWNPKTGELRNSIETEMSEIAQRASVSVRTVKDVLNNELVRRYFLRYNVRRVMTANGVRTAGILLQVRMDDPLTPADQAETGQTEHGTWFSAEFEDESEEY